MNPDDRRIARNRAIQQIVDHRRACSLPGAAFGDGDRPEWQQQAECRNYPHLDWYTNRGESTQLQQQICMGCPVRSECLEYALANREKWGIWGGKSERQRIRIRRGIRPTSTGDAA